jgi:hypothetical protein
VTWRRLVLMLCAAAGCATSWQPLPTERERATWRVADARAQGFPPCEGRTHARDEVCYDAIGITWSGCAWASVLATCAGDAACAVATDADVINNSCGGSPGWQPCPVKAGAEAGK